MHTALQQIDDVQCTHEAVSLLIVMCMQTFVKLTQGAQTPAWVHALTFAVVFAACHQC